MRTFGATLIAIAMMPPLGGCAPRPAQNVAGGIVSTDYCADQMALALVPATRLAAVSVDADDDPWFSAPRAADLPRVQANFEAIMAHRPSVVLRAYGGEPGLAERLRDAGVAVVDVPSSASLADAARDLRAVASSLDAAPAAEARLEAAGIEAALRTPPVPAEPGLYLTPGNVTTGPDGYVGDLLRLGGVETLRTQAGWGPVPLERLTTDPPKRVIRAFFDGRSARQDHWAISRHPVLTRATIGARTLTIPGAWVACGNWLGGHAVRAMRAPR